MRMLQSQGPVNLEIARQIAGVIARRPGRRTTGHRTGDRSRRATRARELVRAAQTHVADTTGHRSAYSRRRARAVDRQGVGRPAPRRVCGPVLEALAARRSAARRTRQPIPTPRRPAADGRHRHRAGAGEEALFGFLMQMLMPVLLGVWSGSMIG